MRQTSSVESAPRQASRRGARSAFIFEIKNLSRIHDEVRVPGALDCLEKPKLDGAHELFHVLFALEADAVFARDFAAESGDGLVQRREGQRFDAVPVFHGHVGVFDEGRVEIAVARVAVAGDGDAELSGDPFEFRNHGGNRRGRHDDVFEALDGAVNLEGLRDVPAYRPQALLRRAVVRHIDFDGSLLHAQVAHRSASLSTRAGSRPSISMSSIAPHSAYGRFSFR